MKERLLTAIGYCVGVTFLILLLCTAPIWLLIWVLTGYNPFKTISEKMNHGLQKHIDDLNAETAKIRANTKKIEKENAATQKIIDDLKRMAREN